jgi:hypothetical protein
MGNLALSFRATRVGTIPLAHPCPCGRRLKGYTCGLATDLAKQGAKDRIK